MSLIYEHWVVTCILIMVTADTVTQIVRVLRHRR